MESVSGCLWNECLDQRGISVRMSVDWVSGWSWNPQPSTQVNQEKPLYSGAFLYLRYDQHPPTARPSSRCAPYPILVDSQNRARAASLLHGAGYALRASLAGQLERGVFLPSVDYVHDLDALKRDAVDQDVVRVGHQLAGAWHTSRAVQVWMIGHRQYGRL
ncbi:hypothetical protein CFBP3846_P400015 (plasmid) [Pseudomonas syringae pv. avii]|uniref:Uncharacterized protein n=1 Tax=Pseudomonas syringae pv. avii TaxID=663959 RepID=A0ABY1UJ14_PSESX|nr:hypothetical protein CFBP3846_P400015 [Pseudomonas syringae pv. avii]